MKALGLATACAVAAWTTLSFAQSPAQVSYCQSLTKSYRQAVSDGKSLANPAGIGQAIADCPTNPNSSIPPLERALNEMKVQLPKR